MLPSHVETMLVTLFTMMYYQRVKTLHCTLNKNTLLALYIKWLRSISIGEVFFKDITVGDILQIKVPTSTEKRGKRIEGSKESK